MPPPQWQELLTCAPLAESRSVVVTGGSRGIGKGIARVFCNQGERAVLLARDADATAAVCHP